MPCCRARPIELELPRHIANRAAATALANVEREALGARGAVLARGTAIYLPTSGDSADVRPVIRTLASHNPRARSMSYEASDDGASCQRVCDGKYFPETSARAGSNTSPASALPDLEAGLIVGVTRVS